MISLQGKQKDKKRKNEANKMKNSKKTLLTIVAGVSVAILCMLAYYGICMFMLQNNMQSSNLHGISIMVIAICSWLALNSNKKNDKKVVE